jgi:hypothetical protein
MKKTGWTVISVALLATASVLFCHHFRIQPLPQVPEKQVYKATNLFCSHLATDPGRSWSIFVELVQEMDNPHPRVRINQEKFSMEDAPGRLHTIFAVRAERVVYVVEAVGASRSKTSELMKMVQGLDVIDKVCVVDSKNPPSWYPLPEIVHPLARL